MSSTYGFKSRLAHQQRDAAPNSRSSHLWWSRTFLPALAQHLFRRPNPRRGESLWLTAIFILKIAATPFGLPLLPAKSLVCSGCSLASAVATPPLHYQLFADKGKGFFYVSLALIVRVYISILTQKSADTARCLPIFTSYLFPLHYFLFTAPVGPGSAHPLPPPAPKPRRYSCPHRRGRGI